MNVCIFLSARKHKVNNGFIVIIIIAPCTWFTEGKSINSVVFIHTCYCPVKACFNLGADIKIILNLPDLRLPY